MYFAIHCIDKPGCGDLRAATRATHLNYLNGLSDKILAGGPLLGLDGGAIGSLLIVDLADRNAAYAFAAADPYALAGLFASTAITAWRRVFPAEA